MAIVVWLIVAEALYVRALRILGRRGVAVPRLQVVLWHLGLSLQAIALLSPIGTHADTLLTAHMGEHILLADLGAPLLLAGLRNPVLVFFLPRDVLVPLARSPRLRGAFRWLRHPLVALPVYTIVLYTWHFSFFFEAAVRHDLVHVLQHVSFVVIAMLVWWSVLEPKRRQLHGDLWKIGHILGARMIGMFLEIYTGVYGSGDRDGISAMADQQTAGAIMVGVDIMIMVFALAFFFWQAARQHDRDVAAEAKQAATLPRAPT